MQATTSATVRWMAVLVLIAILLVFGRAAPAGIAAPPAAGVPMIATRVFDVNCKSLLSVTQSYAKVADLATFAVQSPDSEVELTFQGWISVLAFSADSTGAVFELRVDGNPSSVGRARASLHKPATGGGSEHASFSGYWRGLATGNHTASIWARTVWGTASNAFVDPGCWSTDVLIVKEYLPFGFSFMPALTRE